MCEHTSVDLHLRPGQGVPNWAAPYGTFCRRNRYKEVGCPGKPLRAGQGPTSVACRRAPGGRS